MLPDIAAVRPEVYISMGNTAENLAEQYDISREEQDRFSLQSQCERDGTVRHHVTIQQREDLGCNCG